MKRLMLHEQSNYLSVFGFYRSVKKLHNICVIVFLEFVLRKNQEIFLGFVNVMDVTGLGFARGLGDKFGLKIQLLVDQNYYGAKHSAFGGGHRQLLPSHALKQFMFIVLRILYFLLLQKVAVFGPSKKNIHYKVKNCLSGSEFSKEKLRVQFGIRITTRVDKKCLT